MDCEDKQMNYGEADRLWGNEIDYEVTQIDYEVTR